MNIAKIAHELNRSYCIELGDLSQVPWDEAPDWQRESAEQGVAAIKAGVVTSPAHSHESWLRVKQSEGWKYGQEKDPDAKLHPCMVPFEQLPVELQMKDRLFYGVVKTLLGF